MSAQPNLDRQQVRVKGWWDTIHTAGKCATSGTPQKWQPSHGYIVEDYEQYAAWACQDCPVMGTCYRYGDATNQTGIWGGTYRAKRRPQPQPPQPSVTASARIEQPAVEPLVADWRNNAACLNCPNLPWTEDEATVMERQAMARVCATCPVFDACSTQAEHVKADAGFWAGRDRTRRAPDRRPLDLPWVDDPPTGPPTWAQPAASQQLHLPISLDAQRPGDAA